MITSPGNLTTALTKALQSGHHRIGEILIQTQQNPDGSKEYLLCHHQDQNKTSQPNPLKTYQSPQDALEISRLDDQENYRPLRTAPTLRHGWQLKLDTPEQLKLALDFFYPACLGAWVAQTQQQKLPIQSLRSKLERQTGMYRSAQHISPAGAKQLVAHQCGEHCLKQPLWEIGPKEPNPCDLKSHQKNKATAAHTINLLCIEPCNILVAEAKKISSKEYQEKQASSEA